MRTSLAATLAALMVLTGAAGAHAGPRTTPDRPVAVEAAAAPGAPDGWTVQREPRGFRIVRHRIEGEPVVDARPRIATRSTDLGPAVRSVDGSLEVVVPVLPRDLSTLAVLHGAATEQELLADAGQSRTVRRDELPLPAGVVQAEYRAPALPVRGLKVPADVRGEVVAPAQGTDLPVVVLVHGRHAFCEGDAWTWPCPAGSKPVGSASGYRYLQVALAQQGYFTVSVDLDAVNAQDLPLADAGLEARSAVVLRHLELLAGWQSGASAPFAATVASRYDARRTLLVGHSRGGEAVASVANLQDLSKGYRVQGLVLLAPTNFFHATPATTPTLTVLPGCDGDVSDLDGARYADSAAWYGKQHAVSSTVYLPGANHNDFNTTWTLGAPTGSDDGKWSSCAAGSRLAPEAQRAAGTALVQAAADTFLKGKAPTTGVDGTPGNASTLPAGSIASSAGGAREQIATPDTSGWAATGGSVCAGISCRLTGPSGRTRNPHFSGFADQDPRAWRLTAGSTLTLAPATPQPLIDARYLDVRVVAAPGAALTPRLRVTDSSGRSATVTGTEVRGLKGPSDGSDGGTALAQTVRFPLPLGKVDLWRVAKAELTLDGTGDHLVLGAEKASPGTTPTRMEKPSLLLAPRSTPAVETDSAQTLQVPARLDRPAQRVAHVLTVDPGRWDVAPTAVDTALAAGRTQVSLPVSVPGDDVWRPATKVLRSVETRGPVLVGTPAVEVLVEDDEPAPQVTVTPVAATAAPGGTLRWEVALDRPFGYLQPISLVARPDDSSVPMTVADVAPAAHEHWGIGEAETGPLHANQVFFSKLLGAEETTFVAELPLAADARPGARVTLQVWSPTIPEEAPRYVTGTVESPAG